MPPHARMSLVQQLLMRALVARFWHEPYRPTRLTRWGTELHDRFLLPHFVWKDFDDVIDELNARRLSPSSSTGSRRTSSSASRCSATSRAAASSVELRNALEPWHVMGEEGAAGGTVRYVDSSLERIEVQVTGLDRRAAT